MENLYTPSELLSREAFDQILQAFNEAWAVDTTYPELRDQFTEANKALGHCAPTAVVINDLFDGRICYDKANFHLWNELPDGTQQDFTRSQFTDDRVFTLYKYQTRDDVLTSDTGKRTGIVQRYELLKNRFIERYYR